MYYSLRTVLYVQARALKAVKDVGESLVLEKLKVVGLVMFQDAAEWGGKPMSEWSQQREGHQGGVLQER